MAPQREWFEKDYYKALGVSSTATAKEITSAYRKLAKKHHPDTNPGHEETFKEISAAYDVLGDADRRKEYDEVRAMGPAAGPASRAAASAGPAGPTGRRTWATSATSSAACSAAAVAVAAPPARNGARTSRPSSTCPSRRPSTG